MSKEVELTELIGKIIDYSYLKSSIVVSKERILTKESIQEMIYYIKKNIYNYFRNELKRHCQDLFLDRRPIKQYSFKSLIEILTSWGDYNALPIMMKVVIISIWAYLKKELLEKKTMLCETTIDDIYAIELFYGYVIKNYLTITWSRHAQEFLVHSISRKEEMWTSIAKRMQDVLDALYLQQSREEVLAAVITSDLGNVTYPTLNGWTILHYLCLVSDNLLQHQDLMKILLTAGGNFHATDYKRQTPLHFAALSLNYAAVMNLCSLRGINKSAVDIYGRTPLQVFLETLSVSSRSKLLSAERITAIIKELLPNENVLALWQSWSFILNSDEEVSLTERPIFGRRHQQCAIYYIVKYCNVSVGYELLSQSLPSLQSTPIHLQILLEVFDGAIQTFKNSLLSLLINYLQQDLLWKKVEYRWQILNILVIFSIQANNAEAVLYFIENLLPKCALTPTILLEIQQSSIKRCEYLIFLYLVIINENFGNMKAVIIESAIKHCSIIFGHQLFVISPTGSVHTANTTILSQEVASSNQLEQELEKSIFLPVLYHLITSIDTMARKRKLWEEILFFLDTLNPLFIASFAGNGVALESLLKRVFLISKESRKKHSFSSSGMDLQSAIAEEEFLNTMKRQYVKCVFYSMKFQALSTIESIRGSLGYTSLGDFTFLSDISPNSKLTPFDFWMLLLRSTAQHCFFIEPLTRGKNLSGLYRKLSDTREITDQHVQLLNLFLHSLPLKPLVGSENKSKRLFTNNSHQHHLNDLHLSERIQMIDHILYENIGNVYISQYSFSNQQSSSPMKHLQSNGGNDLKSFVDVGNIMRNLIERSEIAQQCIDEFYLSKMHWMDLKERIQSSKFKVGLKKLSKNYAPDQAWLKLSYQYLQLQNLLFSTAIKSGPPGSEEFSDGKVINIDIKQWKEFEKYLTSICYKDQVFKDHCHQLCQYASFYTEEIVIHRTRATFSSASLFERVSYDAWQQFLTVYHSHNYNIILKNAHQQHQDDQTQQHRRRHYQDNNENESSGRFKFFREKHHEGQEKLRKSNDYLSFAFTTFHQWIQQTIIDGNTYFAHYTKEKYYHTKQYYEIIPSLVLTKYDFYQYYKLYLYRQHLLKSFHLQPHEVISLPFTLLSALFTTNGDQIDEFHRLEKDMTRLAQIMNVFRTSSVPEKQNKDNNRKMKSPVKGNNSLIVNEENNVASYDRKSLSCFAQIESRIRSERNLENILELTVQYHLHNHWNCRALLVYVLPLVSLGKYSLAMKIIEKAKQPEIHSSLHQQALHLDGTLNTEVPETELQFMVIPIESFYHILSIQPQQYEQEIKEILSACRSALFALPSASAGDRTAEKKAAENEKENIKNSNQMLHLYTVTPIHFALQDGQLGFIQLFLSSFPEFTIDFFELFEFIEMTHCYEPWKDFIIILSTFYRNYNVQLYSYYAFDYYYHIKLAKHQSKQAYHPTSFSTSFSSLKKNPFYRGNARRYPAEKQAFYEKTKESILHILFPEFSHHASSLASWLRFWPESGKDFHHSQSRLFNYLVDGKIGGVNSLSSITRSQSNRYESMNSDLSLKSMQTALNGTVSPTEFIKLITFDGNMIPLRDILQNPINLLRCFPQPQEIIGFGPHAETALLNLSRARFYDLIDSMQTGSSSSSSSTPSELYFRINNEGISPFYYLLLQGQYERIYSQLISYFPSTTQTTEASVRNWQSFNNVTQNNYNHHPHLKSLRKGKDGKENYWYNLDLYTNQILHRQYHLLQSKYSFDYLQQILKFPPNLSFYPYVPLGSVLAHITRPTLKRNGDEASENTPKQDHHNNYLLQYSMILQYCKYLWKLLINHNFLRFIQFSSASPYNKLDSFLRARQVLTILNIPYSYLMNQINQESFMDQLLVQSQQTSANITPIRGAAGNNPLISSPTLTNPITTAPNTTKNNTPFTHTENQRKLEGQFQFDPFTFSLRVNYSAFVQLKFLISGFYQLRNNPPPKSSSLTNSTLAAFIPPAFKETNMFSIPPSVSSYRGIDERKENGAPENTSSNEIGGAETAGVDFFASKKNSLLQSHKSLVDTILTFHAPWISSVLLGKSDLTIQEYLQQLPRSGKHKKPSEAEETMFGFPQQPHQQSQPSNQSSLPYYQLPSMEESGVFETRDLLKMIQIELSSGSPHLNPELAASNTSSSLSENDRIKAGILSSFSNSYGRVGGNQAPLSLSKPNIMSDPRALLEALQSAYLIIEFARCLCVCKLFSILTLDVVPALQSLQQTSQLFQSRISGEGKEDGRQPAMLPATKPTPPLRRTSTQFQESRQTREAHSSPSAFATTLLQVPKESLLILTETNLRYQYHPFTLYQKELYDLRFQLYIINDIIKSSNPPATNNASEQVSNQKGLKERIKFCDYITPQEFKNFFKFPSYYSQRINILKEMISNGLAALLMDIGKSQFCELICRLTLQSNAATNTGNDKLPVAAILPFPMEKMDQIDATKTQTGINIGGGGGSSSFRSSGSKLDTERIENFQEILKILQSFTMEDFWFPLLYSSPSKIGEQENQKSKTTGESMRTTLKYASFLSRFTAFSGIQQDNNNNSTEFILIALREGKLLRISFEEEMKIISLLSRSSNNASSSSSLPSAGRIEQMIYETIQTLNSCLRIGSLLYWMLSSIHGLLTQSQTAGTEELPSVRTSSLSSAKRRITHLYDNDESYCRNAEERKYSPLIALCLSKIYFSRLQSKQNKRLHPPHPSTQLNNSKLNLLSPPNFQQEIAKFLMNSSQFSHNYSLRCYEVDDYQRSAIEIVAITGNYELLKLFIDSLTPTVKNTTLSSSTTTRSTNPDQEDISQVKKQYKHLLWHVLMSCPSYSKHLTGSEVIIRSEASLIGYYRCVELLLAKDFSYETPAAHSIGPTKTTLSCLDLMILKQLPILIVEEFLQRYEDDFHNRTLNTEDRVQHRFANHWLSLSLLSFISNNRYEQQNQMNHYRNTIAYDSILLPEDQQQHQDRRDSGFHYNRRGKEEQGERNYDHIFDKLINWTLQAYGVSQEDEFGHESQSSMKTNRPMPYYSLADYFFNSQFLENVILQHAVYERKVCVFPSNNTTNHPSGNNHEREVFIHVQKTLKELLISFQSFLYPYQVLHPTQTIFLQNYCSSLTTTSSQYRNQLNEVVKSKFRKTTGSGGGGGGRGGSSNDGSNGFEKLISLFCPLQGDFSYLIMIYQQLLQLSTIEQMQIKIQEITKEIDTMRKVIMNHQKNYSSFPSSTLSFHSSLTLFTNNNTGANNGATYFDYYQYTLLELAIMKNHEISFVFTWSKVLPTLLFLPTTATSTNSGGSGSDARLVAINYLQRLVVLMVEYNAENVFGVFMKLLWEYCQETSKSQKEAIAQTGELTAKTRGEEKEEKDDLSVLYQQLLVLIANNAIYFPHSLSYQIANYKNSIIPLPANRFFESSQSGGHHHHHRPLCLSSSSSSLTIIHYLLYQQPLPMTFLSCFLHYTNWSVALLHHLLFSSYYSEEALLVVFQHLLLIAREQPSPDSSSQTVDAQTLLRDLEEERFENGQTLFHLFCRYGYTRLLQYCVENDYGVPLVQVKDDYGDLPVNYSIGAGHKEITQFLRAYCPKRMKIALDNLTYFCRFVLLSRFTTTYQQKKKKWKKQRSNPSYFHPEEDESNQDFF